MAVTEYTRGIEWLLENGAGAADIRGVLLRDTSVYTADPDHLTIDAILNTHGGVEITATNYARPTFATPTVTPDDANNEVDYDVADAPQQTDVGLGDVPFQVAEAIVFYIHLGADTLNLPLMHDDTDFPKTLQGGTLDIAINAGGLLSFQT